MSQYWSWLLAAVGLTGMWLAGRNNRMGWAVGIGVQFLWLTYAIATAQWGFLVSAVAYGAVYARNWWSWRKRDLAEAQPSEAAEHG